MRSLPVALSLGLGATLVTHARPAAADEAPSGSLAGFYAGAHYAFGLGDRAAFDTFQYPTLGAFFDHPWFFVSFETPMPFVIVDGVVLLVTYLAGGNDDLPLYSALNGDREPGRVRYFDLQAGMRVARRGPHALELGFRGSMAGLQAYVEGERLGNSVFDLGLSPGYVYATDDVRLRVTVPVGNGFGDDRPKNPFVGASVFAAARVHEHFGLVVRLDAEAQRLDLRLPNDAYRVPNDVVEWTAFGSTTLGLTYLTD